MRVRISILLLLAFATVAQGQYQSFFGEQNTSWNIKDHTQMGLRTDSLVAGSDTSIQSITYRKVHWYAAPGGTAPIHTSYLREDTSYGLLWHRTAPDSAEVLVVKMDLSPGGFFIYQTSIGNETFIVDSVFTHGGARWIRLNVWNHTGFPPLYFIEGVGTSYGIAYSETLWPVIDPYLLCQKKDGILNYINNSLYFSGKCNVSTVDVERTPAPAPFSIYPNPTQEFLNVKSGTASNFCVTILSLTGQIKTDCFTGATGVRLDLTTYSPGLYQLRITDLNGAFMHQELFVLK